MLVTCCLYRKDFKLEEAVEKFAIYDKWADFEYKFSVQVRYEDVEFFILQIAPLCFGLSFV